MSHDLYKTGDKDAPAAILDRNGAVVLGLCRRCGQGEADLTPTCDQGANRRETWAQGRHTRHGVIKSDLIVCGCGAVGEVRVERVFWFFERVRVCWYESEAGANLVRARLPPENARVLVREEDKP